MIFDLNDELLDSIIAAMENQKTKFWVSAEKNSLVEANDSVISDEDLYYALPEWDSASGFTLRKDFVNLIYAPGVRDELQRVLHSGRGVFRNFKNVLKQYPEFDRKWHLYKTRKMRTCVSDWYNELRELWGLEKLDQEPEETDDLVRNDFVFTAYDPARDKEMIVYELKNSMVFFDDELSEPVSDAVTALWIYLFEYGNSDSVVGFICRSQTGEFVGFISAAPCPLNSVQTVSLTSFFVLENYRGLGIGKELFFMCLSTVQRQGFKWVFITDMFMPDTMLPLLQRTGFKECKSGFVMNLTEKKDLL
jgi:GNAT superfamily N-acetyltransferase